MFLHKTGSSSETGKRDFSQNYVNFNALLSFVELRRKIIKNDCFINILTEIL